MTVDTLSDSTPIIVGLKILARVRGVVTRLVARIRSLDANMTASFKRGRCQRPGEPKSGCC